MLTLELLNKHLRMQVNNSNVNPSDLPALPSAIAILWIGTSLKLKGYKIK